MSVMKNKLNGLTWTRFVAGKELCNAYTELNDPVIQREMFMAQALDQAKGDGEAQVKDETFCQSLGRLSYVQC